MPRIRVLPETVQNKIAAGEVIERPASVVKELVENSLDAGATIIEVEIEDGGQRHIRVSDNGRGMDETDLVTSMQRHATSKISDVDDIFRISTFGFRGEALPSIGSVSRLAIVTGTGDSEPGHELLVEGGRMIRLSPAPPRRGTRVEVRDLFYNTPARRKFLRQPTAETTQTAETLTRLALGNPAISFRLQANDRLRLSVKGVEDQLARLGEIFGSELRGKMAPFTGEIADGLSVYGFFAKPPESRKNSGGIYILANRRWIKHYGLSRAVSEEFAGVLAPREHPFAIINLSVDPQRIDVNVHPSKEEVRFDHDRILVGGVRRAIREAMAGLATLPTSSAFLGAKADAHVRPPSGRHPARGTAQTRNWPTDGEQRRLGLPPKRDADLSDLNLAEIRERLRPKDSAMTGATEPFAASEIAREAGPPLEAAAATPENAPVSAEGGYRILGQGCGGFIFVDCASGLLAVDPHALHERLNYDRLVEARRLGGDSVRLLLPLELNLSPAEAAAAEEAVPELAEFGFELVLPEMNRLVVTAAPAFIKPAIIEKLLRHVLADAEGADAALRAAKGKILASLACHSSVLLGKTLPAEEMAAIVEWFFRKGQMPTCPHGRPTAINITKEELFRRMGR